MEEYDLIAKIYDPVLYFALKPIRIDVMNKLLQYKNKSILDLCCGTGDQLKLLSKSGFKNLHCLDISTSMLKVAEKNSKGIVIYNKDATATGFEKESFDVVIISFAIHEKERIVQEKILAESYRLMKKGALLLVVDYEFDNSTFLIGKIGITIVERIAGKNHYKNFRNYIKNNGLKSLIDTEKFELTSHKKRLFNGVTISTYKKMDS